MWMTIFLSFSHKKIPACKCDEEHREDYVFTGKIGGDLLDIVAKHAEKPEVEKGAEVTVSGISQKFDKYTVIVKQKNSRDV